MMRVDYFGERKEHMKNSLLIACGAALLWGAISSGALGEGESAKTPASQPSPRVEVVFVLDTTGSMGGLIQGAKDKIWSIANKIVAGKPRPSVKMGLVAYRDKGDEYVTKVFDLTDNIDQVYTDLTGFKATGGGDTPEHVNKALQDAVEKMSWSKDKGVLKIIYLVGDSPPHNEYSDTPTYDKLAKAAIEKGIYVNTVLCGTNQDTAKVWQEIARLSEGQYVAIAQEGGVVAVSTPMDEELSTLNRKLVETVVVYGKKEAQAEAGKLNTAAKEMPAAGGAGPAAAADRASYAARSGQAGSGDLVQAVKEGKADIAKVAKDELPENMQKMTPAEQTQYVADQQKARDDISKKIVDLSAQREAYIKKELEKKGGAKDSFDAKVVESLQKQAKDKNLNYE
jgi:Mg-chelatase subunit ChlD